MSSCASAAAALDSSLALIDRSSAVLAVAAASGAASILAGGTDLLVQMRAGVRKPGTIIDIKKIPALTAIGCSTVNSYRRLWDQGFWAPVYADWGYQNRTCALRVVGHDAGLRVENRVPGGDVNPYLALAALLG